MSLIASDTLVLETFTEVDVSSAANTWVNLIHVGAISAYGTEAESDERVLLYHKFGSGTTQIFVTDEMEFFLIGHSSATSFTLTYADVPNLSPASVATGELESSDAGKVVSATGDIHIAAATFQAGDTILINNITGSAIDITSDIDLRLAGTAFVGDVQLAAYGICGLLFESASSVKVSGTGLAAAGDEDAEAFFSDAGITDVDVKAAVDDLVVALKAGTLWGKMLAVYPFVQNPGDDSLTQQSFNLKDSAAYQITWTNSPTANDNGVTFDGVTNYGDTGLNLNTTTANSLAFGFYCRTNKQANEVPMGAWVGGDGLEIYPRDSFGGNAVYDNLYNAGAGRVSATTANSQGFYVSSRTSASLHKGYKNGTALGTITGAQGTLPSTNFRFGVRGESAPYGGYNLAFGFISAGLSDAEVAELDTAVDAFELALARNV